MQRRSMKPYARRATINTGGQLNVDPTYPDPAATQHVHSQQNTVDQQGHAGTAMLLSDEQQGEQS